MNKVTGIFVCYSHRLFCTATENQREKDAIRKDNAKDLTMI